MGGKPSKGTSKDMRLKENKPNTGTVKPTTQKPTPPKKASKP